MMMVFQLALVALASLATAEATAGDTDDDYFLPDPNLPADCNIYIDFGSSGPKIYRLFDSPSYEAHLLKKIKGPGCMTAFVNDVQGHNCRRTNRGGGPPLDETLKTWIRTQGSHCRIGAIRATAGNRLSTVPNDWSTLTNLMAPIQVASAKTIGGTEEAFNEFFDAVVQNKGAAAAGPPNFNGYLGWGGASLQLVYSVDADPFTNPVLLQKGTHFHGCNADTHGCGAESQSDFFKFYEEPIPEWAGGGDFRGNFAMVSFLSDRSVPGPMATVGGNDETYEKVKSPGPGSCPDVETTLANIQNADGDVGAALGAFKACLSSDPMMEALFTVWPEDQRGMWQPIFVSQAAGNFDRTTMKEVVENLDEEDLERLPNGQIDVMKWMLRTVSEVSADLERENLAFDGDNRLHKVLKKMMTNGCFFNGHGPEVLTSPPQATFPPTVFGAMYLASVLSVLAGDDDRAFEIMENAAQLGDQAEPIVGYLEADVTHEKVRIVKAEVKDPTPYRPYPLATDLSALERDIRKLEQ